MNRVEDICCEFRSRCNVALREMGIDPSIELAMLSKSQPKSGKSGGAVDDYGESDDETVGSESPECNEEPEQRPSNTFMGMQIGCKCPMDCH